MPQIYAKMKRYKFIQQNGKQVALHRFVYEAIHGKIPDGMEIHHIDGNPENNAPSNLTAVTYKTHIRLTCGWSYLRDGKWAKPCSNCHELLPATTEYFSARKTLIEKGYYVPYCRACANMIARRYYDLNRELILHKARERRLHAKEERKVS